MSNVWFGAIIKHLSGWLEKRVAFDSEKIPFIYRVITSIDNLLQFIEKEVAKTANYAKGHGAFFDHYMKTFHVYKKSLYVYTLSVYMHTYRIRNFEFYTCAYRRKTEKRIDFLVIFYVYVRIRTKKSKKTNFSAKRETHPKD